MNKICHFFMMAMIFVSITSCENYRDDNGSLGGYWQLQEWRTRSTSGAIDSLVTTNTNDTLRLYYAFHRNIFQVYNADNYSNIAYLSKFQRTNDSIFLGDIADYDGNLLVDTNTPQPNYNLFKSYGIPQDGKFKYSQNNNDNLILSSKNDILILRRY